MVPIAILKGKRRFIMEYDYTGQDKVQAKNEEMLQMLRQEANNTVDVYDKLREIGAREELKRMTRRQDADESMAAAIAATPENGSLSDAQVKFLNSRRGLKVDGGDIQNGQIMEAGFNPKTGGYGVVFASVDANGNVSYKPHEIPQTEIYGMMSSRPEWFGSDRVKKLGAAIQNSDPFYTDEQLHSLGTRYMDERNALSERIMNAQASLSGRSGGFGISFGQRAKLEEMKRNRQVEVQKMKNANISFGDKFKELMEIKDYVDNNKDKLDEATRTKLMGAYQNGIMQIAGRYSPQPSGANDGGETSGLSISDDGILHLPNGKAIRKDQEYTNPQDGKKYIWRGGDARNWEEIGGKGTLAP